MNTTPDKNGRLEVLFYLSFTILAFSSIEVAANPIRNLVAPMLITFWRFAIGSVFLLPIALLRCKSQLKRLNLGDIIRLFLLGIMNIIFSMGAHAVCMKYARASTAAILIAANPIATNFFSWLILKEAMEKKRIIALMLGFSGIIIIALRPDTSIDTPLGIAAGIASLTGFGLYTVCSKKMIHKFGSLTVTVVSCLTALIAYLPILYFSNSGFLPVASAWPRLLFLGIVGSGLGYVTFFKALESMPAGKASYLFFFKPPVTILLAWLVLAEKPSESAFIGTALIMCGILIENMRKNITGQTSSY
ncbi:MAG: DMT family transporter [Candidatus Rifleibacteriota bacterium]